MTVSLFTQFICSSILWPSSQTSSQPTWA